MAEPRTRSGTVAHHVDLALRHSALTMDLYAANVVERYHERTPLHLRRLQFHQVGRDAYADLRANEQLVRRMLGDGPVRTPVELEEALVLALPEPFRSECLSELAGRYGLLAAHKPPAPADAAANLRQPADLLREVGQALEVYAPVLADGQVNAADAPQLARLLIELDDVVGVCTSIKAQVAGVLGASPIPINRAASAHPTGAKS